MIATEFGKLIFFNSI